MHNAPLENSASRNIAGSVLSINRTYLNEPHKDTPAVRNKRAKHNVLSVYAAYIECVNFLSVCLCLFVGRIITDCAGAVGADSLCTYWLLPLSRL